MHYRLRTLLVPLAIWSLTCFLAVYALAQNEADPSGEWNWKFPNQSAVWTLKLKLESDKLAGSIKHMQSAPETPIEDASYKDGAIRFRWTYKTRFNTTAVSTYQGTVSANMIKGTQTIKDGDRVVTRDWQATRANQQP